MPKQVAIVDLGLGNLRSVVRAFERAGAAVRLVRKPDDIQKADRLVVPGQGAFRDCSRALGDGVGEALSAKIRAGTPYLGICLGMQALFSSSEESASSHGLGVLPGRVVRFPVNHHDAAGVRLKVPHVGWNEVRSSHPMLPAVDWFYFVHSYYCVPDDPRIAVGESDFGFGFCAAVAKDNLLAVQFHPEKSQDAGARLIDAFLGGQQ